MDHKFMVIILGKDNYVQTLGFDVNFKFLKFQLQ